MKSVFAVLVALFLYACASAPVTVPDEQITSYVMAQAPERIQHCQQSAIATVQGIKAAKQSGVSATAYVEANLASAQANGFSEQLVRDFTDMVYALDTVPQDAVNEVALRYVYECLQHIEQTLGAPGVET